MNFDGKEMQEDFDKSFGINAFGAETGLAHKNITAKQLWWLVKFAKHVRMRCRNNSAFNNYMNRNFPNVTFREVTKHRKDGSTYQGLSIAVNGQEVSEEE